MLVKPPSFAKRRGFGPSLPSSRRTAFRSVCPRQPSRIAHEGEMAAYREAAKEAKASDEILFAYLVELDGMPE
jgi:hypothetical protein